jgi:hypothetical protein
MTETELAALIAAKMTRRSAAAGAEVTGAIAVTAYAAAEDPELVDRGALAAAHTLIEAAAAI